MFISSRLMTTFTHLLIPGTTVLLELVKKFPAFYETRRSITAFTSAHHLSLSWARSIQSIPSHPTSWRSILALSSHLSLGLPSSLFPSGFPTKTLYMPFLWPIRSACPAHLILLDFITRTLLGDEYRSLSSLLCRQAFNTKEIFHYLWNLNFHQHAQKTPVYTLFVANIRLLQNVPPDLIKCNFLLLLRETRYSCA